MSNHHHDMDMEMENNQLLHPHRHPQSNARGSPSHFHSSPSSSSSSLFSTSSPPLMNVQFILRRHHIALLLLIPTIIGLLVFWNPKSDPSSSSSSISSSSRVHPASISKPYECLPYDYDVKKILFSSPLYTSHEEWERSEQITTNKNKYSSPPAAPRGNRVLVTGAAGFIGSHVASYLIDVMHIPYVICNDDMSGGHWSNVHPQCLFVRGDLKDPLFVSYLFETYGPFDVVYHLAAYAAVGLSHFIRHFNYRNNFLSSVELLNQAITTKVPVMVFASSISVYGAAPTPMKETDQCIPEDPYGVSKYAFELDLLAAKEIFGMDSIVFRPHNVYGPNQNIYDPYRNVIGIFMSQILRGEPLTIFGDGSQTRAFSYIDDVAPYIAISPFISATYNQAINIGGDVAYTLNELGSTVSSSFGKPFNVEYLAARKEVQDATADHSKLKCLFGMKDFIGLKDGLERMTKWVRETGSNLKPTKFKRVEIVENLPKAWMSTEIGVNGEKAMGKMRVRKDTSKEDKEITKLNQQLFLQKNDACQLCLSKEKDQQCHKVPTGPITDHCYDEYESPLNYYDGIDPKTDAETGGEGASKTTYHPFGLRK